MVELTVIVPKRDNAGLSLLRERRQVERDLLSLAGGMSRDQIVGMWRDEQTGKVYRDESYRYTVACDEGTAHALAASAATWASLLRQECVYVSVREAQVSFVAPLAAAS